MRNCKWFYFLGLSAISRRSKLPERGKFNSSIAKANYSAAMILMSVSPVYMLSGMLIWLADRAVLFWFVHISMAVMVTPLLIAHIFMVSLKTDRRAALSRGISRFVDRQYLKYNHMTEYGKKVDSDGDTAGNNGKADPASGKSSVRTRCEKKDVKLKQC